MPATITIDTQFTRRQYVRLLVLMAFRGVGLWVMLAIASVALVAELMNGGGVMFFWFILAGIIIYHVYAIGKVTSSIEARRLYLPKRWTFSDDGITIATESAKDEVKWKKFLRWRKRAGIYLLYISEAVFIILPEADVMPEHRGPLDDMLRRHIDKITS